LTGFFMYMGFPYDRLAENLGREIEGGANVQIRYGEVGPQIHWLGPAVAATDLSVISDGVESIRLDELSLRPAWSLSWFRGVPSVYVAATADAARGNFEVTLDDPLHLRGEVQDLDLQQLPVPGALARASLAGTGELEFDLEKPAEGSWQGTARFSIQDGSFAPPDLGIAIPYSTLQSALTLGPDGFLELADTRLDGPVVSGTATGRIAVFQEPGPLDVTLDFNANSPEIQNALRENEIPVSNAGDGQVHFGGSLAKPIID
ncbi:MAG: type II secretion system protein GspN, partial [Myxococcota bacterium]|nr:type II secretion system protein GspN [Myxococcota bacterium]